MCLKTPQGPSLGRSWSSSLKRWVFRGPRELSNCNVAVASNVPQAIILKPGDAQSVETMLVEAEDDATLQEAKAESLRSVHVPCIDNSPVLRPPSWSCRPPRACPKVPTSLESWDPCLSTTASPNLASIPAVSECNVAIASESQLVGSAATVSQVTLVTLKYAIHLPATVLASNPAPNSLTIVYAQSLFIN